MGLTSPIRRLSLSNSSPFSGTRRSHDHRFMANLQDSLKYGNVQGNRSENRIKDTVFTGGFNSETRAHGKRLNYVEQVFVLKSKFLCQVNGCDEKLIDKSLSKTECECGFRICAGCYFDCCSNRPSGICPGCKYPFRQNCGESDNEMSEMNPLRKNRGGIRFENNFSLVRSFKASNREFDHTRWLFRTNGTYGFGNAVWPREGGRGEYEAPPSFNNRMNRPLTRKFGISAAIISPYRLLIVLRLAALGLFLTWRILHPNMDAIWLWSMSVVCEVWFAFSWLMDHYIIQSE